MGAVGLPPNYVKTHHGERAIQVFAQEDCVEMPIDMLDEWVRGLRSWAHGNGNVRELWLFGSRADGRSRPESDVDIAIALLPPTDNPDWALGNYFALNVDWKRQLERIPLIQSVSCVREEVSTLVRFELWQRIGGGSLKCVEGSRG